MRSGLQWCVNEKKTERKSVKESVRERKKQQREAEFAELIVKWQDNKLLILRLKLAKEMENVKSRRGAKSAAQYGTAHQNPLELLKTLVINASAAQN